VLVASPLDPSATSFPVQAAFVPWLGDVISQRLGGDAGVVLEAVPGAPMPALPSGATLERADTASVAAAGASVPAEPGVYYVRRGASRVGALVVNAEGEESMLERLSTRDLRERFRAEDVRTVTTGDALASRVYGTAGGRPLVVPLLLLAAALLIAEGMLARQGTGAAAAIRRARAA
jgi:hypothetical protein